MFQSQELEILALNEYRLLDLPAVTRRAQQARELGFARDVTADAKRGTPIGRLRQALARVSQRRTAPA